MATSNSKAKGKRASRSIEHEVDTHALAIIGYLYNRVVAGATSALRKRTGLSLTEARIVFEIGLNGVTTANKLAKSLGLDKAAISRGVNRLIDLDVVFSEQDLDNAARNLLTLTEAGQVQYEQIKYFTFAREKHLLNVLTDEEERQFLESLRKILTNVESVNKLVTKGYFWPE